MSLYCSASLGSSGSSEYHNLLGVVESRDLFEDFVLFPGNDAVGRAVAAAVVDTAHTKHKTMLALRRLAQDCEGIGNSMGRDLFPCCGCCCCCSFQEADEDQATQSSRSSPLSATVGWTSHSGIN